MSLKSSSAWMFKFETCSIYPSFILKEDCIEFEWLYLWQQFSVNILFFKNTARFISPLLYQLNEPSLWNERILKIQFWNFNFNFFYFIKVEMKWNVFSFVNCNMCIIAVFSQVHIRSRIHFTYKERGFFSLFLRLTENKEVRVIVSNKIQLNSFLLVVNKEIANKKKVKIWFHQKNCWYLLK